MLSAGPLPGLLVAVASVGGSSRQESPPESDGPQDQALRRSVEFICDSSGVISVRFLGQETVELSMAGETQVLRFQRTASGARYVAGHTEFWNKGDEAMLVFGDNRDLCRMATA